MGIFGFAEVFSHTNRTVQNFKCWIKKVIGEEDGSKGLWSNSKRILFAFEVDLRKKKQKKKNYFEIFTETKVF
jgi:hypothetical protein